MKGDCGITGLPSVVWKWVTGSLPPFEHCCSEHDYGYAHVVTPEDRLERDYEIRACIESTGYEKTAKAVFWVLRRFGYIAIIKRNIMRRF